MPSLRSRRSHSSKTPRRKTNGLFLEGNGPPRRGWKPLLQAYRAETAPTSRLEAAPTSVSCRNCPPRRGWKPLLQAYRAETAPTSRLDVAAIVPKLKPLLQAYRVETAPTSRLEAAPTSVSCRNCPHVAAGSRSYKRIVSKLPLRRGWKPLLQAYRVETAPTSRLEAAPTSVSCRNCPYVAAGSRSYKRIVSKLPLRRGWKPLLQAYRVETAPTSRLEAAPT